MLSFAEVAVLNIVYNKKKIQMFLFEYDFYFIREVKNMYISRVSLHS